MKLEKLLELRRVAYRGFSSESGQKLFQEISGGFVACADSDRKKVTMTMPKAHWHAAEILMGFAWERIVEYSAGSTMNVIEERAAGATLEDFERVMGEIGKLEKTNPLMADFALIGISVITTEMKIRKTAKDAATDAEA